LSKAGKSLSYQRHHSDSVVGTGDGGIITHISALVQAASVHAARTAVAQTIAQ
jgi:hypothetical protein